MKDAMTRRNFLGVALTSAALTGAALTGRMANAAEQPNVLFITLDDLNDWLGCYGGHPDAVTPNIDRLARRGVLFTNAHCTSPICGPSRAAILTGLRPETTGVYNNQGVYSDYMPEALTFPEYFRQHGYRTLAAGKINHNYGQPDPLLWDENGPGVGVLGTPFIGDELDTRTMSPTRTIARGDLNITLPANGGLSAIDRPTNAWNSFDWAPLDIPDSEFPDGQIAEWGAAQAESKHDAPFLLAVGFYKPHQPFFAPRAYFDLYDRETIALPPTIAGDLYDVPQPGKDLAVQPWTSGTHRTVMTHGAWRDAIHGYLATVSFADALVGEVVDALERGPNAANTWIVVCSDHGWSLGEKEHWGKHVPWRESVRMPLIIVPPASGAPAGFQPGTRCDAPVNLLDLYPTFTAIAGLSAPPSLEGVSLMPLIADPEAEWAEATVATVGRGSYSVFSRRWRYIRYFDGSEELYDLAADPREWFNVAHTPGNEAIKRRLAEFIPEDARFRQFARWGRWKYVAPVEGEPMLFDYQGVFGISEQDDLAAEHPDVVAAIHGHLQRNAISQRHVVIPDDPAGLAEGE